jgi:hypothetical protein
MSDYLDRDPLDKLLGMGMPAGILASVALVPVFCTTGALVHDPAGCGELRAFGGIEANPPMSLLDTLNRTYECPGIPNVTLCGDCRGEDLNDVDTAFSQLETMSTMLSVVGHELDRLDTFVALSPTSRPNSTWHYLAAARARVDQGING